MADTPSRHTPKPTSTGTGSDSTSTRRGRGVILSEGEVLAGNFTIGKIMGEGGMATVYRATQNSLNRTVAIKVLHSRFVRDPEFVSRFEAEAGALASLQHPNIVNIIDRGHDGDRYFFVMECVEGETLDRRIIDNKLGMAEWRAVVAACREALEYVHKRGIIHRDIKPSNILLNQEGLIKIGDFGIAHIVGGDQAGDGTKTATARALGTANYMAPEQINDPANVDTRADIFSLGVTFYKMLARGLPVGEYAMPSEANHDVPVAVDDVIRKALRADRDQRYQTVREFCDDLLKALKEQTVSITSVLNYRNTPTPTSSLYTGADFRHTPAPVKDKKEPTESGRREPTEKRKAGDRTDTATATAAHSKSKIIEKLSITPPRSTPTPLAGGTGMTPKPVANKDEPRRTPAPVRANNTPAPVSKRAEAARRTAREEAGTKKLLIVAAVVAVLLLGTIIVVVVRMMDGGGGRSGDKSNSSTSITEERQQLLEDVLKEKLEKEKQAGQPGSSAPVPTPVQSSPQPSPVSAAPTPVAASGGTVAPLTAPPFVEGAAS